MADITQDQLDTYKSQYPDNKEIQDLTLKEVLANTAGLSDNWAVVEHSQPPLALSRAAFFPHITPCEKAVANVIIDVILIACSASELSGKFNDETLESVAAAAEPGMAQIEKFVAALGKAETGLEKAQAVWDILKTIYSAGLLGGVMSAIFKGLHWWQALLLGISSIATIAGLVLSDGALAVLELVNLVVSAVFLFDDVINCIEVCQLPAPPKPIVPALCALRTYNLHYMTVANGGRLGGDQAALNTDRTVVGVWEVFTVIPLNKQLGAFALQTSGGQYLTANDGGGLGGPNNATSPCHTDATKIGKFEKVVFVPQGEKGEYQTIAIQTHDQTWITAVNGGDWQSTDNKQPFRTNATVIGPWEQFSLVEA